MLMLTKVYLCKGKEKIKISNSMCVCMREKLRVSKREEQGEINGAYTPPLPHAE